MKIFNVRKTFYDKPELAAVVYGFGIFLLLSFSFVVFFDFFFMLMKNNHILSYAILPLIVLQLPGFLLANMLLAGTQMNGMEDAKLWLLSSLLSSIFWSALVYLTVKISQRRKP